MYAVIEACGKQYKVTKGDVVFFEKLDAEEGKKVTFDNLYNGHQFYAGNKISSGRFAV